MSLARRAAVLTSVTATAVALLVPLAQQAVASDPQGTVVLAKGSSAFADQLQVQGMVDNGVVVGAEDGGLVVVPTAGGAAHPISAQENYVSSSGNYVWLYGSRHASWINVTDSSDTGTVPGKWQSPYPDGGLYLTATSHPRQLIEQTYAQAGTTQQAAAVNLPSYVGRYDSLILGPNGVVIVSTDPDSGASLVNYVAYATQAVEAVPVPPNASLDCRAVSTAAVGCQQGNHVTRLSLTGGDPVVTSAHHINAIGVSDTATAWTTYGGAFNTVPAAGGTVSTLPQFIAVDGYAVGSDGSEFYPARGGDVTVSGVYRVADATGTPDELYAASARPLSASAVDLSAGRAAWQDDSKTNYPVWSRSLTTSGGKITAGAADVLGSSGASGNSAPSLSGIRTAWASIVSSSGTGFSINVSDGEKTTTLPDKSQFPATLSGRRLLYVKHGGTTQDDLLVYDLNDKSKLDLTAKDSAQDAALDGDYVAEARKSGAIVRRSLANGKTTTLSPPLPSGEHWSYSVVYASGDWVAWAISYKKAGKYHERDGYRNARTMTTARSISTGTPVKATADGVILGVGRQKYVLQPWNGAARIKLPASAAIPDVDGSLMAWTDPDGKPKVAPLPKHFADRPRSLGDPDAAPKVHKGKSWAFDLVTTAPLTSCEVKITAKHKTVKTLSCDTKAMKYGEAIASWNTGNGLGKGSYHWTVVAKNSDGSLRNADGTGTSTSGRVKIT